MSNLASESAKSSWVHLLEFQKRRQRRKHFSHFGGAALAAMRLESQLRPDQAGTRR